MTMTTTPVPARSLTKKQVALLNSPGPFRVHTVVLNPAGKPAGLKVFDPSMPGPLHALATKLLIEKEKEGGDYVVEDPRTTRILWTTKGAN